MQVVTRVDLSDAFFDQRNSTLQLHCCSQRLVVL